MTYNHLDTYFQGVVNEYSYYRFKVECNNAVRICHQKKDTIFVFFSDFIHDFDDLWFLVYSNYSLFAEWTLIHILLNDFCYCKTFCLTPFLNVFPYSKSNNKNSMMQISKKNTIYCALHTWNTGHCKMRRIFYYLYV